MVYCYNEGYGKTSDLLKHDLHKLVDPFLGKVRKNAYYCKCGDVPNPKVCFTYGPWKFPTLKEQESLILAFKTEAHLIPVRPVNLQMQNIIGFILWKQQSTYNLIVQKIITLIQAINKELKYQYNFPHYHELKKFHQPVEQGFKKFDSKLSIHSTLSRPTGLEDNDFKIYLKKWRQGFKEPICTCTCPACDYEDYYSRVVTHPQGSWWALRQIPRVLKCSSKEYRRCNIHYENFEFITETRTWSRIVSNKSK